MRPTGMSTRVVGLVSLLALVACGTTARTQSGADSSMTDSVVSTSITSTSSSESSATLVIANTSVALKTVTQAVQLVGCLCKLVPFNATTVKMLSARELASSIGSALESAGSHGMVEMMAGYFTDDSMTGASGLLLVDRPAWLLAVHDALEVPSGPPDRPHIPRVSTFVFVYDAVTGQSLVEFIYTEGPVACSLPPSGTPDRCGLG